MPCHHIPGIYRGAPRRCRPRGAWCMDHCMVHGAWCTVLGPAWVGAGCWRLETGPDRGLPCWGPYQCKRSSLEQCPLVADRQRKPAPLVSGHWSLGPGPGGRGGIWKLYTCIWPCMYNMDPKAISNYILDMVYSLYIHLAMPIPAPNQIPS